MLQFGTHTIISLEKVHATYNYRAAHWVMNDYSRYSSVSVSAMLRT